MHVRKSTTPSPTRKPEIPASMEALHRSTQQFVGVIDQEKFGADQKEPETPLPTTKSKTTVLREDLHQVTTQIAETTSNSDNHITKSHTVQNVTPPNCEFFGDVGENPCLFIETMSQYFRRANINDDSEKVIGFRRCLYGAARAWYDAQTHHNQTYENLLNEFAIHFNVHVYEDQKTEEKVVAFISKMEGLVKLLNPEMPPEMADKVISLMRMELQRNLNADNVSNIEQLLDIVMDIEDQHRRMNLMD